ncbi:MAG: hypothetical protein JWO32_90, partial [Bacteroidetes bacterium]|nr:hypothetical protein [Bacteroidota bacterium]
LIAGLTLTSFTAKPNGPLKETDTSNEKVIKESLVFSASITEQKVEILFSTDQTGKVNFVFAKTNDAILKNKIEKQFYTLHFTELKQDVINSVTLNFKIK